MQTVINWHEYPDVKPSEYGRYLVYVADVNDLGISRFTKITSWASFAEWSDAFSCVIEEGQSVLRWAELPCPESSSQYNSSHDEFAESFASVIPHRILSALQSTCLTEEEAYFILRFAGRVGYEKSIIRLQGRPIHRIRRWLIWIGGWETSEISQWDRGKKEWEFRNEYSGRWNSPVPISFFGHFITIQNRWIEISRLTIHWPDHLGGWGIYWSPNGTPWHANARFLVDQRGYKQRI